MDTKTDYAPVSAVSAVGGADDAPLDLELGAEPEEVETAANPDAKSAVPSAQGESFRELNRGRPRKDLMPSGATVGDKPTPLPRPKYTLFKSDATSLNQKSKAGFSWINAAQPWVKDRILIYVYREWPLLRLLSDEEKKSGAQSNIDKIPGNDAPQDDIDLLHKYGCGTYKLLVNDIEGNTVMTIIVVSAGGNDLKSHPPTDRRVSDIGQVDLNRKENTSYVEFLRMRGLLPEQARTSERAENVATIEAVKTVTEQYGALVNRVLDKSDESKNGGFDREVMSGVMDVVKDSVRTANEITAKSVDRANEILDGARTQMRDNSSGNNGGGGTDPLQLAMQLVALINKGGGDSGEIAQLRRELADANNKRLEFLERQLMEAKAAPAVAPTGPFGSITEGVKALRSMREVVDEFSGGGGGGSGSGNRVSDAVEEAAGNMLPPWAKPFVAIGVPLLTALAQGYFASRGGVMPGMPSQLQPQPQPYPQPLQAQLGSGGGGNNGGGYSIPPYPGVPLSPPGPQLVQQAPGAPAPVPSPSSTPAPSSSPSPMDAEMEEVLSSLAIPLGTYMRDEDTDGENFASMVYNVYGKYIFEAVSSAGEAVVLQTVTSYPPMQKRIAGVPRARIERFVREFCAARPQDEVQEDESTSNGGDRTA